MATAVIDGITTRYEVVGSGEPLLMFSPGGLRRDARQVADAGRLRPHQDPRSPVEALTRASSSTGARRGSRAAASSASPGALRAAGSRPAGASRHRARAHHGRVHGLLSGGRVRRRRIRRRRGACCSSGRSAARSTASTPTCGLRSTSRTSNSTASRKSCRWQRRWKSFSQDPRGGPWAPVLRRDARSRTPTPQDADRYQLLVAAMVRTLFDRDTAPGAEPEDLTAAATSPRSSCPAVTRPTRRRRRATSMSACPRRSTGTCRSTIRPRKTRPARLLEFLSAAG